MSLISAGILLFMVMDPFGNVPIFLSVLRSVPAEKRQIVIIRELLIALFVLLVFLFAGQSFLKVLQISEPSLRIAGGIILFLIAIKMIFGETEVFRETPGGDPLIVPLAIPSIAGPSALATVLLLSGQEPERWPEWALSLFLAWISTTFILLLSERLVRLLGERVMSAIESLMGLILTAISVEMFLQGIKTVFCG